MTVPETRRKGRATVSVAGGLEQRLLAYAAAAGASLVSTQAASAKVIYTPINLTVTGTVPLDLNHDGVVDFNLVERSELGLTIQFSETALYALRVNGAGSPGAGVVGGTFRNYPLASALPWNAAIGPDEHFLHAQNRGVGMASLYVFFDTGLCRGGFAGSFCYGVTDRFLGLRFVVSGKTYYGWAGFSVVKIKRNRPRIIARLTGVAYEDVPGRPIRAGDLEGARATIETAPDPQPATLGLLALGAPGLDIWRKRERV